MTPFSLIKGFFLTKTQPDQAVRESPRLMKSSQNVVGNSLSVRAGLCAVVAAVILTGGCSVDSQSSIVTARPSSTAIVKHWGSFFGEGSNGKGYFGTERSPVAVTVPGTVAEIGTSNSTQYALLTNGSLYAWGLGTHGELGNGGLQNSFSRAVRVRFPAGVKIASIPADVMPYNTALAVDRQGHAWGWGGNSGGELCLGNKSAHRTPVRLPLSHVTTLAGASGHALYDADGTVYACGLNRNGVLGDRSTRNSTTPVKVARLNGSSVIQLVAGFDNAGALLSSGKYFDWGYDAHGQLGTGPRRRPSDVPVRVHLPRPVTQVAQGGSIWRNGQTLVMLSDGSLWAWGDDRAGQLGNGTRGFQSSPVRFHPPAGVTYRSLATGADTSYAISSTGQVYAWGASQAGQIGNGSTRTVTIPVLVASGATSISSTAYNVAIDVPGRPDPPS
jgi:alpha-tubulin suppressor-like RCC1 family protein